MAVRLYKNYSDAVRAARQKSDKSRKANYSVETRYVIKRKPGVIKRLFNI